jgi:hypothetical protein
VIRPHGQVTGPCKLLSSWPLFFPVVYNIRPGSRRSSDVRRPSVFLLEKPVAVLNDVEDRIVDCRVVH